MNLPARNRQFLAFTRGLQLSALEAEARRVWPNMAVAPNGLRVLHRVPYGSVTAQYSDPASFSYQWGDVEISRNEAERRTRGEA